MAKELIYNKSSKYIRKKKKPKPGALELNARVG
jgi:hypothetical protein